MNSIEHFSIELTNEDTCIPEEANIIQFELKTNSMKSQRHTSDRVKTSSSFCGHFGIISVASSLG